jgi:DNA helicase-2/ATP-dependent DNA helicase PcrA
VTEIVLGPPGTGKTTTLLNLVDDEMGKGADPSRIGYITFTKKGANEAADRARKKFGFDGEQLTYFRTIHSLCYRRLGLRNSDVLTGKAFFEFSDYAGVRVTGRSWSDDGMLTGFLEGDRILFMENLSRIRQISLRQQYDEDNDGLDWNEVRRVATALDVFKKRRGLLDYTDMLLEFVANGQDAGLERLFVDESQDLSALQWEVVRLLARSCKRVVVAGDDDQAIFEWAGADVTQFVDMQGEASTLGQSWRVPSAVQKVADGVIKGVRHRRTKKWAAKQGAKGTVERAPDFDGIELDASGSVLILARNTYILRDQVEAQLRARGVVYEFGGKPSIDPGMVQAAATWVDLQKDAPIELGDARNMYKYIAANTGIKRGHKKLEKFGDEDAVPVTLRELRAEGGLLVDPTLAWHDALDRIPPGDMAYMRAARRHGERLRGGKPRVRLSTIHSAKGGEADHVVLMKEIAARTFGEMTKTQKKEDEERRVWYVGVTRAKQRLSLVDAKTVRSCPWL